MDVLKVWMDLQWLAHPHMTITDHAVFAEAKRRIAELLAAADEAQKLLAESVQFDGGGMDENGNGDPGGYRSQWDQEADCVASQLAQCLAACRACQPSAATRAEGTPCAPSTTK